ncbi:hypothetical protein [Streptomyces sp. NPDC088254]
MRLIMRHPHAVHNHRGMMQPGGVEHEVQPALGGERRATDTGQ